MINANEYGFLPENTPYKNSESLQKAVDSGGVIQVSVPGVYKISEQIEIGDNTKLVFREGVILQREASVTGINGNAFINKGALNGEYNRNIEIIGLHLECNGIESNDFGVNSRIAGLRAQVAMIYVENLEINKFECHGLLEKDYAIQVSAFLCAICTRHRRESCRKSLLLSCHPDQRSFRLFRFQSNPREYLRLRNQKR